MRVDLNCDLGECSGGDVTSGITDIMESITSANIACGVHAGDVRTMRAVVKLAKQFRVAIGAHPGLDDPFGFGRREVFIEPLEIVELVKVQLETLDRVATSEGCALRHVKPHGALYNMASRDQKYAEPIVRAVVDTNPRLILFGLSGSELIKAGKAAGLSVASEVFADRVYEATGLLTPRSVEGSVIENSQQVVDRAITMIRDGEVKARGGERVKLDVDTICIHGDTLGAANLVTCVRAGLESAGIQVEPMR